MQQRQPGRQEDLVARLELAKQRVEDLEKELHHEQANPAMDETPDQQDVTALQATESRLKTLIENLPGRLYRADARWVPKFSGSGEDLYGYSSAELTQKIGGWLPIVYPEDREEARQQWELLIQAPQSTVQTYRIVEKSGEVRWVEDRKTSLFSPRGKFLYVDGVILDIHERKRAEEMLEQTNQMARVGGWELDFTNGRLLWSDVTREIHEVSADFVPDLDTAIGFYKEGESRDKISAAVSRSI